MPMWKRAANRSANNLPHLDDIMHINVLLFASLRERFGQGALELDLIAATTVGGVWQQLSGDHERLPHRVLCAVNQQYADHEVMLRDGDEVAFFPPVTGG